MGLNKGNQAPLLTRRQTIGILAGSVAMSALSLSGCGGLFGGGGGELTGVNVNYSLPSGFALPTSDLVGETVWESGALGNGAFATKMLSGSRPIFGFIRDAVNDRYVLPGIVGAGQAGISPTGAAVAAMAMILSGFGLSKADLTSLIEQLEMEPAIQQLGDVIEAQMLIDPYAFFNENAAIDAAIEAAYNSLAPTPGSAPSAGSTANRNDNLITIEPGDQSMARVIQAEDDTGAVTVYNLGRRPMAVYVYRIADEDENGVREDLPTPELITGPTDVEVTDGLISGLLHIRWSFTPKKGPTIPLGVHPGKSKSYYEVLTLMASAAEGAPEPAFFLDAKYQSFVDGWRAKLGDLNVQAGIGGFFAGFVQTIIGGSFAGFADAAITAAITANLRGLENQLVSIAIEQLQNSAFKHGISNCLSAVAGAEREALKLFIQRWPGRIGAGADGINAAQAALVKQAATLQAAATVALRLIGAVGSILTALDWGFDASDLVASSRGEKWSGTAVSPKVVINPTSATLAPNSEQNFTAQIVANVPGANYTYIWSLSGGTSSVLSDRSVTPPKVGRSVETDSAAVTLVVSPSEVDQTQLVVEVEALRVEIVNGARVLTSIGTSQANVTIHVGTTNEAGMFVDTDWDVIPPSTQVRFIAAYVEFDTQQGATTYTIRGNGPPNGTYPDGTVWRALTTLGWWPGELTPYLVHRAEGKLWFHLESLYAANANVELTKSQLRDRWGDWVWTIEVT